MSTQVCTVNDGLIDPDAFPAKASDLDTGVIRGSAASIRAMGTATSSGTDHVAATWKGLSGCYQAPEQEQVYALMDPAVASAHALSAAFGSAAGHLETYADALEGHRATLAGVEADARAFRASVINGVQVDASSSTQAGFTDYLWGAIDWVPGVDERQVTVPWYEDGASVEKNKDLLARYGAVLADISSAATTCANAVQGLVTRTCVAPAVAIPAQALTGADGTPLPWGAVVEEHRNCAESVGHGAYQFGSGLAQGVGMLTLGYNPANGDFFTGTGYGQAWGGTVNLLGSLVLATSPTTWAGALAYATGKTDDPVSKWLYERIATTAGLSALVGYDVNAKDGWHKWREDGVATGTESVLNIAMFFIPGVGEADAGVEGVSLAARLARVSELGADFVVPGGSWVIRGGIRFADTFGNALRVGDRVLPMFEDGTAVGAKALTLKPASLIDLVDDATAPRAPHTPVSDKIFGPTAPEVPGRVEPHATEPHATEPHPVEPTSSGPVDPAHEPTGSHAVDPGSHPAAVSPGDRGPSQWDGKQLPDGRPDVTDVPPEHRGDPAYDPANPQYDGTARGEHGNIGTVNPDAGLSPSGLTHNGRLIDPTVVPEQLRPYVDSGVVINDHGVLRLADDVTLTFDRANPAHDLQEFTRQGHLQEQALNQQSVTDWQDRVDAYRTDGRTEQAAQHIYREQQVRLVVDGYLRDGLSPEAAATQARADVQGLAVLHGPDQVAGGNPLQFTGMGDSRINSSYGNQWGRQGIATELFRATTERLAGSGIPPEFLGDVRMNVQIEVRDVLVGIR